MILAAKLISEIVSLTFRVRNSNSCYQLSDISLYGPLWSAGRGGEGLATIMTNLAGPNTYFCGDD